MNAKIIMYDSDEAAQFKVDTIGWVDRFDHYWGDNEHAARMAGCTHHPCSGCKGSVHRGATLCQTCTKKKQAKDYEETEGKEWNGDTPLYSMLNDQFWFADFRHLFEDCEGPGHSVEDLQLYICDPEYLTPIGDDRWLDDLPSEQYGQIGCVELPDDVWNAVEALNEAIKKQGRVAWSQGSCRAIITNKQREKYDLPRKSV